MQPNKRFAKIPRQSWALLKDKLQEVEDDWGPKMSEKCHIMRWLDSRTALVVFEDEAQEVPTFDKAVDEHLRRLLQHQEMEIEHGQDDDDTLTWEVGIRTVCSFHDARDQREISGGNRRRAHGVFLIIFQTFL